MCALAPRVVDLHALPAKVLGPLLNAREHARLTHRLGWLNGAWSPSRPDGGYVLTLARPEERLVAQMLIHLGRAEAGNAIGDTERWADAALARESDADARARAYPWTAVDGVLDLPDSWSAEALLPHRGRLRLVYAGPATKPPDWLLRASLHSVVLSRFPTERPESVDGFADAGNVASELQFIKGPAHLALSLTRCRLGFDYRSRAPPPPESPF